MVKICNDEYNSNEYSEYFNNYSFELSNFQKYAIKGIIEGDHVLVTAHTGSGKTLPAEFAIEYFTKNKKKVIYTSPIKALSNQKFHEFTKQFPDISIGILTGDIKFNPEAEVIIMTTEILQNTLYQMQSKEDKTINLHFKMDIENELGCVIFDEIHYINDADRGKVWEECILMLPKQIQMVMLSATIDKSEEFARWCESRYNNKDVILASTNHRVVPLTHYSYIHTTQSIYKHIKDKETQKQIRDVVGKLHVLKKQNHTFEDETYIKVKKIMDMIQKERIFIKPSFILNSLIKHLYENNMLPALCFVFSRKNVERYAKDINVNLFDYDDAHVPSIMKKECEQIIRKLPNYKEYLQLPEYLDMIKLLEKGVAIHHSGIMPILREMVEILFAKGYIKVLFATETFAVGINMPTKTVVFTGLSKYNGTQNRFLLGHEYTQMAGRAGRRGLDTVGYVIHCNNIFSNFHPCINDYKLIMSGKPQTLVSKFGISYNLILSLISVNNTDFESFIKKSMLQNEIKKYIDSSKQKLEKEEEEYKELRNSIDIYNDLTVYSSIVNNISCLNGNQKKKSIKKLQQLEEKYSNIKEDSNKYRDLLEKENKLKKLREEYKNTNDYILRNVNIILKILEDNEFIEVDISNNYLLTSKGRIASSIHEVPCIVISEMIINGNFEDLNIIEIIALFSCYTNINVSDDIKLHKCKSGNKVLNDTINNMKYLLFKYGDIEQNLGLNILNDGDSLVYDIIPEVMEWCNSNNENDCKFVLEKLNISKEIFLGEFIKAILKIQNIFNELEGVCDYLGDIKLLSKLKEGKQLLLKFVATNQSLYV